jgi:hypothetical protein
MNMAILSEECGSKAFLSVLWNLANTAYSHVDGVVDVDGVDVVEVDVVEVDVVEVDVVEVDVVDVDVAESVGEIL